MAFKVEKTSPYSPDDRHDEYFDCRTVEEAAERVEDLTPLYFNEIVGELKSEGQIGYEDPDGGYSVLAWEYHVDKETL